MHDFYAPIRTTQASMDPGNMGPLGEWLPEAIWPKLKSLERTKRFSNIGDAMQSDSDDWQVRLEQATPTPTTLFYERCELLDYTAAENGNVEASFELGGAGSPRHPTTNLRFCFTNHDKPMPLTSPPSGQQLQAYTSMSSYTARATLSSTQLL